MQIGGAEFQRPSFFISTLDGGCWSSLPRPFTLVERASLSHSTHWMRGCASSRLGLEVLVKTKFFLSRDSNPDRPALILVTTKTEPLRLPALRCLNEFYIQTWKCPHCMTRSWQYSLAIPRHFLPRFPQITLQFDKFVYMVTLYGFYETGTLRQLHRQCRKIPTL